MSKPRWYKNKAGGVSTILRPAIAISPAEYRWLKKKLAEVPRVGPKDKPKLNDILYHLTKRIIDQEMQREGEWTE